MKDKLEKNGHKKYYYRAKTALGIFLFVLAVAGVSSLPIVISYQVAEAQAKAEDTSLVSNDPSASSETSLDSTEGEE